MPYGPPSYGMFWGHFFLKHGGSGWSELLSSMIKSQEGKGTFPGLRRFHRAKILEIAENADAENAENAAD